jgi:protein TonB
VSTNTQPPEETPLLEPDVEPEPPPDEPPLDPPLLLLDSPPEELPLEEPPEPPPEPLETPPEAPPEDPPGPTSLVLPPHAPNAEAHKRRSAEPRAVRVASEVVMDAPAQYTGRASVKRREGLEFASIGCARSVHGIPRLSQAPPG